MTHLGKLTPQARGGLSSRPVPGVADARPIDPRRWLVLGTLVAAHHSAKSQGAALKLAHLGSKFQEVLQITKLLTVFDVYNSEAEAVASFAK